MEPTVEFDKSSFVVRSVENNNQTVITIIGGSQIGDIYGIYWLINEINTGLTLKNQSLLDVNQTIIPESSFRLIGPGGLGMQANKSAWMKEDYSLSNRRYEDLFLVNEPYINQTAFETLQTNFKRYLSLSIKNGYNYIQMSGFMNLIDFKYVGNGNVIYKEGSKYLERHAATRDALNQLFSYATSLGTGVIISTDMVALSAPLKDYFETKYGEIDTTIPEFWDIYQKGIRELFDFVNIFGLMIRIGEAGSAYNVEESLYSSELLVKDKESVQLMLNALLEVHEEYNKTMIFRTWSVGVGEIADMHTNPETYNLLLEEINSNNLIVSTKFTMGDFYNYLPFNPTLLTGHHRRIIEFQARREFERFMAFPNYMGDLHQTALTYFRENNNIIGIWLWSQGGGPPRAGPLSLYPFHH